MIKELVLKYKISNYIINLDGERFKVSKEEIDKVISDVNRLNEQCNDYINKAAIKLQNCCNLCSYAYSQKVYIYRFKKLFIDMGINYYVKILVLLGRCDKSIKIITERLNQYKYLI